MKLSHMIGIIALLGNIAGTQATSMAQVALIARGAMAMGAGIALFFPLISELHIHSLIQAIITHNNEQFNTKLRGISPNHTPHLPIYKAEYSHMQGSAPLLWAATVGNVYACKALLNCKPINVNATTRDGQTALHIAGSNWLKSTTMMLDRKVDEYPHWLITNRQTAKDLIELFIKHGVDATIKDNNGLTIFNLIQDKKDLSDEHKTEITDFINQCVANAHKARRSNLLF